MTTEIVSYRPTEAVVADLAAKYAKVVFDVTVPSGMNAAKLAYKDINTHSITLEAARVKEKAESLAYGRKVDSEAKRIADQLDALRLPIKAQIETETKRAEREAAEKAQAEIDRIAAEQAAFKAAEEKRMAEERAAIAKAQAELVATQKAAQDKIDAEAREARRKIEEEERASRLAREEADRIARQAREAEEAKAKKARDEEDARLKVERDKLEAERRAVEEAQRKEREAEEARQREIKRKEAEQADSKAMLLLFKQRFGHLPQYAAVIEAINEVLK